MLSVQHHYLPHQPHKSQLFHRWTEVPPTDQPQTLSSMYSYGYLGCLHAQMFLDSIAHCQLLVKQSGLNQCNFLIHSYFHRDTLCPQHQNWDHSKERALQVGENRCHQCSPWQGSKIHPQPPCCLQSIREKKIRMVKCQRLRRMHCFLDAIFGLILFIQIAQRCL